MPKIQSHTVIDITPEKFLNACDSTELNELELLLSSPRYREKMNEVEIEDEWPQEEFENLPMAGPIPQELLDSFPEKEVRRCHQCGCTDDDCRQCIDRTGEPCHWVAEDLCSACAENAEPEKTNL
ncbi:hypothetical protein VS868_11875 [Salinimicrobium sp. 3283s]|uniref:hypothetical protein n=1 Tax=Salinimicrobium sp. 3283s TaxID=3114359 RepID=UPI0031E92628